MSDFRGFTSMAERLSPEQVMTIVNRHLGTMVEVISQYQGTIDEFIGDSIFVIFGAPVQRQDDPQRAVACALAMQLAMASVNAQLRADGLPEVHMGVGVHTGEVVVGNIGSNKRAKYGVVGSHVNLTARIESYTVGGQILISAATQRELAPLLRIAARMEVNTKGVDEPLVLYDIRGLEGDYHLALPEHDETFVPLQESLPICYTILEGKYVGETTSVGSLVALSTQGGEVYSETPVDLWSDVQIRLTGHTGEALPGSFYAKIMGYLPGDGTGFRVRFTSVSPEVGTFFQNLLASSYPGESA
jgi:adenylate cyclase